MWDCPKGHRFTSAVYAKCSKGPGKGCPYCSGKSVLPGFNDLLSREPGVAAEWNNILNVVLPSEVTPKSTRYAWWTCSVGHVYCTKIQNRVQRGSSCPYCSGRLPVPGVNDLLTRNPKLCLEWDYELNYKDPRYVSEYSNKNAHWICKFGHRWVHKVSARSSGSGRCPKCPNGGSSKVESILAEGISDNLGIEVQRNHPVYAKFRGKSYFRGDIMFFFGGREVRVEYDGVYWHRDRAKIDIEKTEAILSTGALLIRVRESCYGDSLEMLDMTHQNLLQVQSVWDAKGAWVEDVVENIKRFLEEKNNED